MALPAVSCAFPGGCPPDPPLLPGMLPTTAPQGAAGGPAGSSPKKAQETAANAGIHLLLPIWAWLRQGSPGG
eukprot:9734328-Alexandrium_andersonii.AAC.1